MGKNEKLSSKLSVVKNGETFMRNKMKYAYTRWLYIMGLEETVLLVSNDSYFVDSHVTKHWHIYWYRQEKIDND